MTEKRIRRLSKEERQYLLRLARETITAVTEGKPLPEIVLDDLPPNLREPAACFVTLHRHGQLRGCTGVLVAQLPLAQEVVKTAVQTALHDPRFTPVTAREVPALEIEISVLTPPQELDVPDPRELPRLLHPGIDGVTLYRGPYRATFLPQVWDTLPDPVEFLDRLCQKMGLPARSWREPGLRVEIYHVEEFSESDVAEE